MSKIVLSAEQERGLALLRNTRLDGGVGLLIGEAGSGKSTGLNIFRKDFPQTVVTAPTGLAAINVGGGTIDRFMGWRLGETRVKQLSNRNKNRLLRSGVLVLDEVSMLRADKVDRLDRDLRTTMQSSQPFGGIGVFFIGDPFQLEPIVPNSGPEAKYWQGLGYRSPYFFDSRVWERCNPQTVMLSKVFRQSDNDAFRNALNKIRLGDTSALEYINQRAGQMPVKGAIKLCFRNNTATYENETALQMLSGEARVYQGIKKGDVGNDLPSPEFLVLKVGARVMATINEPTEPGEEPRFINGDMGFVRELKKDSVSVEFDRAGRIEMTYNVWSLAEQSVDDQGELITGVENDDTPSYTQIPLKLAYAITVHKSQGMTLDAVHLQLEGNGFGAGQGYVAFSRCRNFETMSISREVTEKDIIVSQRVVEWYQELAQINAYIKREGVAA